MSTCRFNARGKHCDGLESHLRGRLENIPSRLTLWKAEISNSPIVHHARMQTFLNICINNKGSKIMLSNSVLHCDETRWAFENTRVFYISQVFSNVLSVLSQCNTRLRLLHLLYDIEITK